MEPEVTLAELNQHILPTANEFANWSAIQNDLRAQNFTIVDVQSNSGENPYLILSRETDEGQQYYHGSAGEILSSLENDNYDFQPIDESLPTEGLIVVQEKNTGKSFIAKANDDN